VARETALPPHPAMARAEDSVASRSAGEPFVAKLAEFFPHATPVRIPVRVTYKGSLSENTVIEFGTPSEVLFASNLPLEFADSLRLKNADGSLDAAVVVVAMQYRGGETAIAARFSDEVSNWIVKP
jgi:hypothetical protein